MYCVDRVKLWTANDTVQCMITRKCVCMHDIACHLCLAPSENSVDSVCIPCACTPYIDYYVGWIIPF